MASTEFPTPVLQSAALQVTVTLSPKPRRGWGGGVEGGGVDGGVVGSKIRQRSNKQNCLDRLTSQETAGNAVGKLRTATSDG